MNLAGQPGVLEIILIVLALVWLLNAFRRASILKKMENEIDHARSDRKSGRSATPEKKTGNRNDRIEEDAEYVDYEIIE